VCVVCLDGSLQQSLMPISTAEENRCGSNHLPTSDIIASDVTSSSAVSDPRQLRFVPIVYVDEEGTPTCYEVVEPVPSPSYFAPSSAQQAGLSLCRCFSCLSGFCSICCCVLRKFSGDILPSAKCASVLLQYIYHFRGPRYF